MGETSFSLSEDHRSNGWGDVHTFEFFIDAAEYWKDRPFCIDIFRGVEDSACWNLTHAEAKELWMALGCALVTHKPAEFNA